MGHFTSINVNYFRTFSSHYMKNMYTDLVLNCQKKEAKLILITVKPICPLN